MTTWHDYLKEEGQPPSWPYPIRFGEEQEIEADVLVVGGGIAGCWAAISAARTGVKVVMLEKGDTVRSGAGGPGCDHWCDAPANPHSRVDPDEWAEHMAAGPYSCGIGVQIQCREDWDTLLEMEQMGGKIRDTDDEYVGAIGRYDDTKLMFSPRYGIKHSLLPLPGAGEPGFNPEEERSNVVIRIWGSTFKPILKKECKRLGVKIMDRVAGTSLLTENGVQGGRVIGATGLNSRTGEFVIVKSKATIVSTGGSGDLWLMNSELCGMSSMGSRTNSGEGVVMGFKAGAEITNLETNMPIRIATGHRHKWYSGAGDASYENVPIVDANGKRVPYPIQGWEDAGAMSSLPDVQMKIDEDVKKGIYELPFYGDWPSMSDVERRATWNLMLGEESTTKIIIDTFNQAGFDGSRDLQQSYKFIEGSGTGYPQWRSGGGSFMIDWNLKTNLDGLYVAGTPCVGAQDHSYCAATGRYAGRKAAAYVKEVAQGNVSRDQIQKEKERIYAPTRRDKGIEWKEFHAGIARINQYYNSEYKTENLFKIGLGALERMEKEFAPQLYALDPHKLLRTIEDLTMLEHSKMIFQASMARKASRFGFQRIDYPEIDPPGWNKFLIAKLENNKFTTSLKEQRFWGNMKEQYEAHNKDYTGVYKR